MTNDRFGNLLGAYVLEELTADEERDLEHHWSTSAKPTPFSES